MCLRIGIFVIWDYESDRALLWRRDMVRFLLFHVKLESVVEQADCALPGVCFAWVGL